MFCYNKIKLDNCTWLLVSVLYSCDLRQGTVLLHTDHLGFLLLSKGLTNQFAIQTDATAPTGEPEQPHKADNMAASNNRDHTHDHSIIACSHHLYMGAILCPHPICGESCINIRQEVATKPFTATFLHKLDFCWRRFNQSWWCLICSNSLHYIGI